MFFFHTVVLVLVVIVIIIIVVVRRKQRSRSILSLTAAAAARATDNKTYQLELKLKRDDTVQNTLYAIPAVAKQENIYDNPEYSTINTYDKPADDHPTNSYVNLQQGNDHVYDIPKVKKTSTSSLSLMHRKESKSRYERLSTVEEPRDDP